MPEYLAAGVYVEEISFRAKPIAGVSTSIAGFIGKVDAGNRKYSKKPLLVESWKNFINIFGDFDNQNKMLVYGIKGFFENGGQRCCPMPPQKMACSMLWINWPVLVKFHWFSCRE